MPDKRELLKQEILKKLMEKCPDPEKCSLCGQKKWVVVDGIFETREFYHGALRAGGNIIPLIPITCANCGNMLFLNAMQLGINMEYLSKEEVKK